MLRIRLYLLYDLQEFMTEVRRLLQLVATLASFRRDTMGWDMGWKD